MVGNGRNIKKLVCNVELAKIMPLIEVLYLAVENQGATYLYAQIFLWLVEYDILSSFVVFNASFSNISVIS
jgi:hypothetical protein